MRIGVVYPQTEYPSDPAAIRDYAQAVEELGFSHLLAYDHVLGAHPDVVDRLPGPYTYHDPFQEPFVLFAYMAAVTRKLEFTTGILILPQRETALAAKQAATLDVLSGGRLRLGFGVGWNPVEYAALNMDFRTRGRRIEEQVDLLRRLWTEPLVTYRGRWHTIPEAGINPLPVQQPIPIWFGGHAEPVLERVARMGDGWMPNYRRAGDARPAVEKLSRYLEESGRSLSEIGLEARISYGDGDPEKWRRWLADWQDLYITHASVNTMKLGFRKPEDHLDALRKFAQAMGVEKET